MNKWMMTDELRKLEPETVGWLADLLWELLDDFSRCDCLFSGCPGPAKRIVMLRTCVRCSGMRRTIEALDLMGEDADGEKRLHGGWEE